MDTFSRKHRLRQLQLQKQQQLMPTDYLTYDKENLKPFSQQQYHQHQLQSAANGGAIRSGVSLTQKCITRDTNNEFELENDQFKVIRVTGLEKPISCETSKFPANAPESATPSKRASISLVRRQPTICSSSNDLLLSQHCLSDSSGFSSSSYSTQVEIKHLKPIANTTTLSNQSKLIDELGRLIMHVDGAASPGDSYPSCVDNVRQQDSTLVRSNERTNSSLCGDEFSSFIALQSDEKPTTITFVEGTKLEELRVKCHDNYYSTIPDQELSYNSIEDGNWSLQSDSNWHSQKSLSNLLERHVAKVQSLLRLVSGDKNVSMVEAFGQSDIPISEEFCIPVRFESANTKPTGKRIVHELEIVDLQDGENLLEKTIRYKLEGTEVPFICPLDLQLDWSKSCTEAPNQVNLSQDLQTLKQSIIQKLLKHHKEALKKSLVSKVSEHVNEFVDKYVDFNNHLRAYTTFSSDWHENWLFASSTGANDSVSRQSSDENEDEDEDRIASKRARIGNEDSFCDLLRYSTLILNGGRQQSRRSLRYLTDQLVSDSSLDDISKVDQYYGEQEEQMIELRKMNTIGLPDVCQLLLEEDYCEGTETIAKQRTTRKLEISYESSRLHVTDAAGHFSFMAYGYFIKTPLLISPNTKLMKLAKFKQLTLRRLENLLKVPIAVQPATAPSNHQVHFSINVTNVELVSRLQVVQFCAQVAGYLPISVRWFRGSQEISSIQQQAGQTSCEWPVWFHANYDYQYKTDWSSWYRFRRNRDRILFEIRCPNKEQDYDVPYRCVIQNYCSQAECNFSLKARPLKESPTTGVVDLNNKDRSLDEVKEIEDQRKPTSGATNSKARAVLRTWSQRTLKPQARVLEGTSFVDEELNLQSRHLNSLAKTSSSKTPVNEDRFGKDFPYHPENLLKRLRENIFSISANRKNTHYSSHQLENYAQIVEQQINFEPLEEPKLVELTMLKQASTTPDANQCASMQAVPTIRGKDPPKPQDRLSKIAANVNQLPDNNQSSWMIYHESSEANNNLDMPKTMPIALNNHKSSEVVASNSSSKTGQTGLCQNKISPHADSNGNYKLKTCVKSLISKFNMV